MKTTQNRFKSWALWVSVAGALWVILSAFGVPEQIGLTSDMYNTILNCVGTILAIFGIVNNPTEKSSL